jgi:uncharacterized protein YbjT (DUF2867 family)
MRTALVIGATGLIGKQLVDLLLSDPDLDKVKVFARKEIPSHTIKQIFIKTAFDSLDGIKNEITGTDLFICMGTTIKVAGSQAQFHKVDHDYPLNFAKLARENGVVNVYLVSSIGANSKSRNFYLRTKGELEEHLAALNFNKTIIFQPSMLLGKRKEKRLGEKVGQIVMTKLNFLLFGPLSIYRAVDSLKVAKAMQAWTLKDYKGLRVISSFEILNNF